MSGERKLAVIDCGTNTFHLMIAKVNGTGFEIVSREKVPVKIGEGGINQGVITSQAVDRAMDALAGFRKKIDSLEIDAVMGFATSAFRNARNGRELADQVNRDYNIPIEIISGDREAELIFKGVNSALKLNQTALVMDIGGGSVEFIIGSDSGILWKQSFEIGGQRLVEMFHKHDPITQSDMELLERHAEEHLQSLFDALAKHKPTLLAGSSGTFDTLSDIYRKQVGIDDDDSSPELPLTFESYQQIHRDLISKDREERLLIPGMIPLRVEMIVVASCLIHYILKRHTFEGIRVSTYSLKEGLLAEITAQ